MKALLIALFSAAALSAQTYTVTEHGHPCRADMTPQLVSTPMGAGLRLGVHSQFTNSLAVLAIGHRMPTPFQLPGGPCRLFVMPRGTQLGSTNANGNEMFAFRIPNAQPPFHIEFQAVVLAVTPTGLHTASTDVTRLTVQ